MLDWIQDLWNHISAVQFEPLNILEILLLAYIFYHLFKLIKDTRAGIIIKGLLVLLVFFGVAQLLGFKVIMYIAEKTLSMLVIALMLIFQPELRRALERLGQKNYLADILEGNKPKEKATVLTQRTIEELVEASCRLAEAKTGALMVIEREIPLGEYVNTGIRVDAAISAALLINIFEKNTPLHDGAVIIQGGRISSATCYLPLSANEKIKKTLGTRHRAAIGVSETSDSITIVVSEETGEISLAQGGKLKQGLSRGDLRRELLTLEKKDEKKNGKNGSKNDKKRRPAEKKEAAAEQTLAAEDRETENKAENASENGSEQTEELQSRGKSRRKAGN